jgi:uncharacterized integral membrane protein
MDEVRIVRKRTHVWPVVIALVILALVIAFVFFMNHGPANTVGWNGMMHWPLDGGQLAG